jgi:hypothetical protein
MEGHVLTFATMPSLQRCNLVNEHLLILEGMDIREINKLVSDVSEISEIIPLVVALYCARKKPPYNILVWLFCLSAPLKIISMITGRLGIYNMPLFHILALVEVTLLYSFFSVIIAGRIQWVGLVLLIVFSVVDSLYLEPIINVSKFNYITWSINTLVLLCMGLMVYYKIFTSSEIIVLESSPIFIIVSGLMIYFAGSLFTYAFAPRIFGQWYSNNFINNAWIVQSLSALIKNLIVAFGLWKVKPLSATR